MEKTREYDPKDQHFHVLHNTTNSTCAANHDTGTAASPNYILSLGRCDVVSFSSVTFLHSFLVLSLSLSNEAKHLALRQLDHSFMFSRECPCSRGVCQRRSDDHTE